MENKKLFQIGDVAKMFHISVGSLRRYEQAGLLKPEYTDPETGYRYYSARQFEVLIRFVTCAFWICHWVRLESFWETETST